MSEQQEQQTQDNQTEQAQPAVPSTPAEKMFTQDEVNALVQERLAKQKRSLEKKQSTNNDTQKAQPQDDQAVQALQKRLEEVLQKQQYLEIKTAIQDRGVRDPALVDVLISAHRAESPDDVNEWLDGKKSLFTAKQEQAPAQTEQKQETKPAQQQTIANSPAPSGGPDYSGAIDFTKLTKDDVRNLQASGRFLDVLERYRSQIGGSSVFRKRGVPMKG
jgi:flagellar hook-basal body complex protein FliE